MTDAQVIKQVTSRIDLALNENAKRERIIVGALIALFVVGLSLILWGAMQREWAFLVPGGILQLAVLYPVQRLIKLREDNMRLQILPELMRLATTQQAKVLAAKLVDRLIEQV